MPLSMSKCGKGSMAFSNNKFSSRLIAQHFLCLGNERYHCSIWIYIIFFSLSVSMTCFGPENPYFDVFAVLFVSSFSLSRINIIFHKIYNYSDRVSFEDIFEWLFQRSYKHFFVCGINNKRINRQCHCLTDWQSNTLLLKFPSLDGVKDWFLSQNWRTDSNQSSKVSKQTNMWFVYCAMANNIKPFDF